MDAGEAEALIDQLVAQGEGRIPGMVETRLEQLASILEDAGEGEREGSEAGDGLGGESAEELEAELEEVLGSTSGAAGVTLTELVWSMAEGMLGVYHQMGVTTTSWLTAADARVCAPCMANEGAGYIPIGDSFPSGDTQPPGHVMCRCCLVPGDISGVPLPFRSA